MPAAESTQSPRSHFGVNSPKGDNKSFGWGNAGNKTADGGGAAAKPAGNNAALANLMTQVTPEEAERLKKDQQQRAADGAGGKDQGSKSDVTGSSRDGHTKECVCCQSCWSCLFGRDGGRPAGGTHHDGSAQDTHIEAVPVPAHLQQTGADPNHHGRREETPSSERSESHTPDGLLGPQDADVRGLKTLVLDLDETLVHSSFQEVECTFHVPIEIEGQRHEVFVLKRPFVDEFLLECSKHYEIVVFTASLGQYANPVLDELDTHGVIKHRLFRESCVLHNGSAYVKDLSRLGRREKNSIIIDNSPLSYLFHPRNAIGCESWFGNKEDTELRDLVPVLTTTLKDCADVRHILNANTRSLQWVCNQASQPQEVE